jgi:hypothetical protein
MSNEKNLNARSRTNKNKIVSKKGKSLVNPERLVIDSRIYLTLKSAQHGRPKEFISFLIKIIGGIIAFFISIWVRMEMPVLYICYMFAGLLLFVLSLTLSLLYWWLIGVDVRNNIRMLEQEMLASNKKIYALIDWIVVLAILAVPLGAIFLFWFLVLSLN